MKISIVVPIYNVERYLRRCIESLINQSYKNLEIILVDDGSSDNSAVICDEYAQKDKRILVIHQKNKGLAETRNVGVNVATGDYLYFLDSDDYIDVDTIEQMMQLSIKNDADIVVSGFYLEYENGSKTRNNKKNIKICMDSVNALGLFLYSRYINPIAWAKLYKRKLFQNIKYPSGKIYEDMATTYKVLKKAERVFYDSSPFYHYIQRKSSIGKIADKDLNFQLEDAVEQFWKHINKNEKIVAMSYVGRCFWLLVVYNRLICAEQIDFRLKQKIRNETKICKTILCKYISSRKKIQLLLFKFSPSTYTKIYRRIYLHKKEKMMK